MPTLEKRFRTTDTKLFLIYNTQGATQLKVKQMEYLKHVTGMYKNRSGIRNNKERAQLEKRTSGCYKGNEVTFYAFYVTLLIPLRKSRKVFIENRILIIVNRILPYFSTNFNGTFVNRREIGVSTLSLCYTKNQVLTILLAG